METTQNPFVTVDVYRHGYKNGVVAGIVISTIAPLVIKGVASKIAKGLRKSPKNPE